MKCQGWNLCCHMQGKSLPQYAISLAPIRIIFLPKPLWAHLCNGFSGTLIGLRKVPEATSWFLEQPGLPDSLLSQSHFC